MAARDCAVQSTVCAPPASGGRAVGRGNRGSGGGPFRHAGRDTQNKATTALLRQCLTKLSVEHREVLDLVYYHEKSVNEVSEIVGVPEGTVKTRMFHARRKLAELLKAEGLERGSI